VTQSKVVATQLLGNLQLILAFMGFGLITRMGTTHKTAIPKTPSIQIRYFALHNLEFCL